MSLMMPGIDDDEFVYDPDQECSWLAVEFAHFGFAVLLDLACGYAVPVNVRWRAVVEKQARLASVSRAEWLVVGSEVERLLAIPEGEGL